MGGVVPSVPDVPVEDIKKMAADVFGVFGPAYTKAYALELIRQMKKEKELRSEGDWPWLRVPPTPAEPLWQASFEKMGLVRENWKKRTFVFMNEADNYEIRYYDAAEVDVSDEKCPPPKGVIRPSGYSVKVMPEERAKEQYGSEWALSFKPYWSSDRRRVWSLRFEDKETRDKCAANLRTARWNTRGAGNPDPVMREAFKAAYRDTRWALGIWGYFTCYKTEEEMLGQLIVDKCESEVMPPVYEKLPAGAAAGIVRKQVVKILDTTVGAAVAGLWKGVAAGVETAKPTVKSAADASIGPVIDLQLELAGKITDVVGGIVTPIVETITKPVFGPMAEALGGPIAEAYVKTIKALSERITAVFDAGADSTKKLDQLERECYWWWGLMHEPYMAVRKLTRPGDEAAPGRGAQIFAALMEIVVAMNPEMSMWRLEWTIERSIKDLAVRMVYTYKSLVAEGLPNAQSTLDLTLAMAVHDAKARGFEVLNSILFGTVAPKLDQDIRPAVAEPLGPLKELIVPPLDVLVDIDDMANSVIYGLINSVVDGIVAPAMDSPAWTELSGLAPAGVEVGEDLQLAAKEVFVAMGMEDPIPTPAEALELAKKNGGAGAGGAAAGASGGSAPAGESEKKEEAPAPAAAPAGETEEAAAPAAAETAAAPAEAAPAPAPDAPVETEE